MINSDLLSLLKRINKKAELIEGGLPPDMSAYIQMTRNYLRSILAPPHDGYIHEHAEVGVYAFLLQDALEKVDKYERGRNRGNAN